MNNILYKDCWNGNWKYNLVDLEQWLKIVVVFFSFPSWKNTTNKSQITIPYSCFSRVKVILEVVNVKYVFVI
jgi:hypothetical protein